jgi:hypothetical protein
MEGGPLHPRALPPPHQSTFRNPSLTRPSVRPPARPSARPIPRPSTALNVHTMATMNRNREAEMGDVIFAQYICSLVTVPLFLALFLHVCQTYF